MLLGFHNNLSTDAQVHVINISVNFYDSTLNTVGDSCYTIFVTDGQNFILLAFATTKTTGAPQNVLTSVPVKLSGIRATQEMWRTYRRTENSDKNCLSPLLGARKKYV